MDKHNITYHYSFSFANLEEHMRKLGHADRNLTIFKCDIEGGEYPVFANMFKENQRRWRWADRIGQVLMEIHTKKYSDNANRTAGYIDLMEAEGFRIFSSEVNFAMIVEVLLLEGVKVKSMRGKLLPSFRSAG